MGQVMGGRRRELETKMRELEGERRAREAEARAFAGREEDWRRERRRLLLEAARLRGRVKELQGEEKKKTTRSNVVQNQQQGGGEAVVAEGGGGEGEKRMRELEEERQVRRQQEQLVMVERMKEEQRRREEAVEKWKQLYLAIKAELDDLIQRTHHQGERFCWGAAEQQQGVIEALQRELKARDETVESLRLKISSMEKEGVRRDREIDILRQSMRILSYSKRNHRGTRRSLSRGLHM